MSLKTRISEDMKSAMKARDSLRLSAIRMLMAAIKQREVDERIVLDDAAVVTVVERALKQRRDAAEQYSLAGRSDLADKERFEIEVLSAYLPTQLDTDAIDAEIDKAIAAVGATGPADLGKLMGALKAALAGRANMGTVSSRARAVLAAKA